MFAIVLTVLVLGLAVTMDKIRLKILKELYSELSKIHSISRHTNYYLKTDNPSP